MSIHSSSPATLLSPLHQFPYHPHPSNKLVALTPISSSHSTYCVVQLHLEVLEEVPAVSFAGGQALVLHHSIVAKLFELLILVEQDARGRLGGLEPMLCPPVHLADLVGT